MTVLEARSRLDSMAAGWRRRQSVTLLVRTVALALPLASIAFVVISGGTFRLLGVLAAAAIASLVALALPHAPRADTLLIARHLDRVRPALEESATLLLEPDRRLTTLGRLQQSRAASVLAAIDPDTIFPARGWRRPAGELLAGLLVAMTLLVVIDRYDTATTFGGRSPLSPATRTTTGPFEGLEIRIEPPAYTGLPARTQQALDLEVEAGGTVTWRLPARDDLAADLVTGDGAAESLRRSGDALTLSVTPPDSTVYRLVARAPGQDADRTPFAHLGVVPDEPPLLAIVQPVERLTVLPADVDRLEVEIRARDDYRITGAELVATLALGSGELVEFRERRIPLGVESDGPEATFRHRFDLRELGVGPAAELYFHAEARDNRQPEPNVGRSPTTIVRVVGDSATTEGLGEGLPIILPPTYFRSQRQIIIDTEKLIADRDALSGEEFRRRSEALGGDQRALRMRYGALLGEEFVSGQAVEAGETEVEDDHQDEPGQGGSERRAEEKVDSVFDVLPEGLFHAHDSTEMATFFASETRARLKRMLGRMWEAEGRLRVIDPEGALPYEHQALELLKELQQASRVYVQKVGFEAPPLEPEERRLSGELDEIRTLHAEVIPEARPELEATARSLLARLERPDDLDLSSASAEARLLRQPVADLATRDPEAVAALEGIDDLLASRVPAEPVRSSLRTALWALLPAPDPVPVHPTGARDSLSRHYRELRAAEDGR